MSTKLWLAAGLAIMCCSAMGVAAADTYDGSITSLQNFINKHGPQLKGWRPPAVLATETLSDGKTVLRYARWDAERGKAFQGTVVYFSGRGEFIERNTQTYSDLASMGWEVWTFDWRGQGWSTRPLPGERAIRGHIDRFETYVHDAKELIDGIVKRGKPPDEVYALVAHSMGGQIALRYMEEYPGDFKFAVLSSPLVELPGGWLAKEATVLKEAEADFENFIRNNSEAIQRCVATEAAAWTTSFTRTACEALLAPKRSALRDEATAYEYTRDETNLAESECLVEMSRKNEADSGLAVTCPTVGWLVAAHESTNRVSEAAATLKTPILIVGAKNDKRVDPDAEVALCGRLANCTIVQVPGAGHELLIERPEVHKAFLDCFDAFAHDPTKAGGKSCDNTVRRIH